jgi:hypothetical protein
MPVRKANAREAGMLCISNALHCAAPGCEGDSRKHLCQTLCGNALCRGQHANFRVIWPGTRLRLTLPSVFPCGRGRQVRVRYTERPPTARNTVRCVGAQGILVTVMISVYFCWRSAKENAHPGTTVRQLCHAHDLSHLWCMTGTSGKRERERAGTHAPSP